MLRSDGVSFRICKGCGTIPIENPKTGLFVCPLCTGPVSYIGSGATDLELIPPIRKTMIAPVTLEMPYAFKLLSQELETYMNIGMRILTEKDVLQMNGLALSDLPSIKDAGGLREGIVLPERILPESVVPEYREEEEGPTEASPELLMKLGAGPKLAPTVSDEDSIVVDGTGVQGAIATAAAVAAQGTAPGVVPGTLVQTQQGPMFQPNPTTVTVLPPARSINVLPGEAEEVQADEVLDSGAATAQGAQGAQRRVGFQNEVNASNTIPQMYPQQQMQMQQPMYPMQPQIQMQQMPQQFNMSPYPGRNMGATPAIYAASAPQPAQMFTSGVPGAPPTFSIPTDPETMQQFGMPQPVIKPRRSITLRKGRSGPGFSSGQGQGQEDEGQSGGSSANIVVTVTKGN